MAKFINAKDTLKIANYDGRKISLCNIEDKPMKIIFPRMYMPFGISGFTPEVGPTKYNIDFAMKDGMKMVTLLRSSTSVCVKLKIKLFKLFPTKVKTFLVNQ